MKKNHSSTQQLSIFDIVIEPPKQSAFPSVPSEPAKQKETSVRASANLCPYKIPTVAEIVKEVQQASVRVSTSKLLSDVFECGAIAISNKVDFTQYGEREERYKDIMNSYSPKERETLADIFAKIFALLSSMVYDDGAFDDYLGSIFMQSDMGNKHAGQFFTPYHISKLCAKMSIGEGAALKAKSDEILTINDPCCGSGGMMIAALDVLQNDYGVNYAYNCFVECSDIDIRCVHMTYLQLSLAGVPAIIKHQNALTRKVWSVWKTPAYLIQYLRFRKYEY